MICASCGHEQAASARFCQDCGAALVRRCADCHGELTASAKFCPECGTAVAVATGPAPLARSVADYTPKHLADKILQSRAALEGERKQVTVLFCDIKGSMALARQLDAEEWHQVLDGYFERLATAVHRYEGTINQYTGDGIMALFGAPIAHEDHARRACYAALDARADLAEYAERLRLERAIDLGVRMGLNSGEVVVGRIGDDLRMDYTAQGHTVGLAQRMEQLAGAGHVCLGESTRRLVEGFFEVRHLGRASPRGMEPVEVFELERANESRTRLDVARARGLTRFVGRADEQHVLAAALARARAGHGQVVGVVGDAGLGKSRLCYEFVERCRAEGLAVTEAHCPAHGRNIPFLPILELLRSYFDVRADDGPEQARRKVAGTLALLDDSLREALPVLFDFMGIAEAGEGAAEDDRQQRLVALVHGLFRAHTARDRPGLVVIDDLHWIDAGSDALLAQVVAAAAGSRSLVLLNFRPEYSAPWMRSAHYQQLPLVPLAEPELRELVAHLLGPEPALAELAGRIVAWTGGNPFYTEEVVQNLVETGALAGSRGAYRLVEDVATLAAPPNVHAVLAARIDRLAETPKRLLQMAAVIGREFAAPVLAAVDGLGSEQRAAALEQLKAADFVFERALYPRAEYGFKHPLTHEVAYNTVLKQRRAEIHRQVAEVTERNAADAIEAAAAIIAYHRERSDDPPSAVPWHARAAAWGGHRDIAASVHHLRRMLELLESAGVDPAADAWRMQACSGLIFLAYRIGAPDREVEGLLDQGVAAATRIGRGAQAALFTGMHGMYLGVGRGDCAAYWRAGIAAARAADAIDDPELQYCARIFHLWGAMFSGRLEEARQVGADVLARNDSRLDFGRRYMLQSPLTAHFVGLAFAELARGDLGVAEALLARALPLARMERDAESESGITALLARCAGLRGDHVARRRYAREAFDAGMRSESLLGQIFGPLNFGMTLVADGALEEGLARLDQVRQCIDDTEGVLILSGLVDAHRAEVWLRKGDLTEARRLARHAVDLNRAGEILFDLSPWPILAEIEIACGDAPAAHAILDELDAIIARTGARATAPALHGLRALFARSFGREWDADGEIAAARSLCRTLGMPGEGERIDSLLRPQGG
ncbi:MAG: adenylate/guanylate cyclase domain-containing protein [Gammaproteobacteria bacterium]